MSQSESGVRLLDGKAIAQEILDNVAKRAADMRAAGWPLKLISVSIGDVSAVEMYVRNQQRKAELAGIEFEQRSYPTSITENEMFAVVAAMNADPWVTGIIVQRPVPEHLSIKTLQSAIHPLKDVEGMHPASIGNIVYNQLDLAPCTAKASVELLKRTRLELQGLEVVVVGHSEIVGKPIAFLLLSEGATVTVCHHMTRNLALHLQHAEAVFVAVGKPNLITKDLLKPGVALIDIGINRIDDGKGGTKIVGDVDFDSCKEVAGWITPVPGGVGPLTVAILMQNTLVAGERQKTQYESTYSAG